MRTTLLLLALIAAPALASQTVWKWTDANGVTHYSDRSVPGAVPMVIGDSNSSSAEASFSPSPDPAPRPPANAGPPYADFEIWQPGPEEVIINTGGAVTVNIRLNPMLGSGHSVYLYLDGRLVEGFPGNTLTFDLKEVPRGEHTVVAAIVDGQGEKVQETAAVRFMVRQKSIAQLQVGLKLRPS